MEELFESLYEEYARKIYGYYYMCFSNRETAEDLTQTVFMKVYRHLKRNRFFMPDSWKAWIFRIAVNVKNDHLREMQRLVECEDIESLQLADTLHNPENAVDSISVNSALEKLSRSDRDIIRMKNEGYTSEEIGRYMGVCDSTARSRAQTAKNNFIGALKAEDAELS